MLNELSTQHSTFYVVARKGFEPLQTGPKPVVLPLDDRAISRLGTAKIEEFIFSHKKLGYFFYLFNLCAIKNG